MPERYVCLEAPQSFWGHAEASLNSLVTPGFKSSAALASLMPWTHEPCLCSPPIDLLRTCAIYGATAVDCHLKNWLYTSYPQYLC